MGKLSTSAVSFIGDWSNILTIIFTVLVALAATVSFIAPSPLIAKRATVFGLVIGWLTIFPACLTFWTSGVREEYAEKRVAEIERQASPRRLSSDQKQRLIAELKRFPGQQVRIISPQINESSDYAFDFVDVFLGANWRVVDKDTIHGITFVSYDRELQGIHVAMPSAKADDMHGSAVALVAALTHQHLPTSWKTQKDFDEPSVIEFYVGAKPFKGFGSK